MANKPCVLAYSGGLDTSAIVVWLVERGYDVHAVLVDVGQNEDLHGLCDKALRTGAVSAVVRDARPAMFRNVVPNAIALAATYEGQYRLGTALARPFIAAEQVAVARELGGATLVHGATGKGNDQVRFEFAYRSLAPECPVLAPWKVWDLHGRKDLVEYLQKHGVKDQFALTKDFSLDENLWHLSVEGGPLEDRGGVLNVESVLAGVADHFGVIGGTAAGAAQTAVEVEFIDGVPVALNGEPMPLPQLLAALNADFRNAPWAWDLVIENRFTGVKSRGLYINPAAKLLHMAVDGLARSVFNKPTFDQWVSLGQQYGAILYRGEYFSDQRVIVETTARAIRRHLTGSVTVQLSPTPYVARVEAKKAVFRKELATFEASEFSHGDAAGFISLSWLSSVGKSFVEDHAHADLVETATAPASDVCGTQPLPSRGLVPAPV